MTQARRDLNRDTPKVFLPASSRGMLWLAGFGLLSLAIVSLLLFVMISSGQLQIAFIVIPVTVICVILASAAFVLAGWMPSMQYELGCRVLVMRCGPIKYNIPLAEITAVRKTNLVPSTRRAIRLPGFALGNVSCLDAGDVTMCATRWVDVILIETKKKKYGLTPRDERSFLHELKRYVT